MSRRLVLDDGRTHRELLMVGTMIVGRDPACEISDADPRLSRRHAEFQVTAEGVIVRDLQSRNGIQVNGLPVTEAVLKPGDTIQVAHLALKFVDDDGPPTPPRRGAAPSGVQVREGFEDDRTRITAGPRSGARRADVATAQMPAMRMPAAVDPGDIVIRDRGAVPPAHVPAPALDLTAGGLLAEAWGRRVLGQAVLLALVVFLVTAIPLVAWQARMAGGTDPLRVVGLLVVPLAASVAAAVMGASVMVRTAARGLRQDGRR